MCDSSFNQSAFVALVFVTGTCNLYIRPTFIFCIPEKSDSFFRRSPIHFSGLLQHISTVFSLQHKKYFFPLSRRENEHGGRDVKRTSQILSWWNMDYVEAF